MKETLSKIASLIEDIRNTLDEAEAEERKADEPSVTYQLGSVGPATEVIQTVKYPWATQSRVVARFYAWDGPMRARGEKSVELANEWIRFKKGQDEQR